MTNIDIKENNLYRLDSRLIEILLIDRTTKKNLIWATDNYSSRGAGYQSGDHISVYAIIKRNGSTLLSLALKSRKKNNLSALNRKRKFSLRLGFAMHKTILSITLGSEKKMFSIPKQKKAGRQTAKKLYSPKAKLGKIMSRKTALKLLAVKLPILSVAMMLLRGTKYL